MTATEAPPKDATVRPSLFTVSFIALVSATFLTYSSNFLITPVLPLLVLDLGGDAALIGVIVAAFSFPSLVMRPFFGRLADERTVHGTWSLGAVMVTLASVLYLVPSLIAILVVRILHGVGWAAFNTGGHTTLAKTAPPARRGEATSIYNLAFGLAQTIMPGIGLLLLSGQGFAVPFLVAGALALAGLALIRWGPVPIAIPAGRRSAAHGGRQQLLERGAILPMLFEFLFSASVPLYFAFLPVYALERGIPLDALALFFPVYGIAFVATRLLVARSADRIGRRALLALSVLSATIGLGIGFLASDLTGIIASGALYALGASLEGPAAMALAIDRSDPQRVGSAMATYSLGYQMALGVGAATFGFVIDLYRFPAPFAVAIGMQLVLAAILAWQWRYLPGGQSSGTIGVTATP